MGFKTGGVALTDAQKLAYAKANGSILLDSHVVSAPEDNFIFSLPAGYYDFILSGRGVMLNSAASNLLTFAIGDEGVGGDFYKDDTTFLGYQIVQETIGVGLPNMTAQTPEDGYGYLLALQGGADAIGMFDAVIDPGSATWWAMINSRGQGLYSASPLKFTSRISNTMYLEKVRMNAFRVCTAFEGGQIVQGDFALFGRAHP